MTQFFLSVHRLKTLSHFDLKSWVTGGTKIWPNFLSQTDYFFSQCSEKKKLSHFDLKSWVTGGIIIRPGKVSNWRIFESIGFSMLSQFDSQCWVNLTLNVESTYSQCWANLTLNVESIWLKYSPVIHFAGLNFSFASDSTFYVKMTFFLSLCVS